MLAELSQKLIQGEDLTLEEAKAALLCMVRDETPDDAIASLLTALSIKGESAHEVAGFASGMRSLLSPVPCDREPLLDTAGTGGGCETFNISTTAALVIAGADVVVAKHGNRAVTSRSGSADLLEELGIDLEAATARASQCLEEVGIGFLFAPHFHPTMKRVAAVRRQLAHRTIFNMAGPLTNPARASFHLIGVWEPKLTNILAEAFSLLDGERAWIVHSQDGMDELSVLDQNWVAEAENGRVRPFKLDPAKFRFESLEGDLLGGDAAHNAAISQGILKREIVDVKRSVVLFNAAAGLALCLNVSLEEGLERARESVDSGRAYARLQDLVQMTSHA